MDPKKMLITPEKTVEADEKKAAAEAAEAAEEEALQQHYEHMDSFLSEVENNPEKLKAAGKEREGDDSLIADNATVLRTGLKMVIGGEVSDEEISHFSEQAPSIRADLAESIRKDMSKTPPEELAAIAKGLRKMMGKDPLRRALAEKALKELNIIDSDAPSEADAENDKEKA